MYGLKPVPFMRGLLGTPMSRALSSQPWLAIETHPEQQILHSAEESRSAQDDTSK